MLLTAKVYMSDVSSPGYRGTVCQIPDLKRSTGLTYLSKLSQTSPVSYSTQRRLYYIKYVFF